MTSRFLVSDSAVSPCNNEAHVLTRDLGTVRPACYRPRDHLWSDDCTQMFNPCVNSLCGRVVIKYPGCCVDKLHRNLRIWVTDLPNHVRGGGRLG